MNVTFVRANWSSMSWHPFPKTIIIWLKTFNFMIKQLNDYRTLTCKRFNMCFCHYFWMPEICLYCIKFNKTSVILSFQSALGVQDLGKFFHKPIRDENGTIVLVTINHIRDTKHVNTNHARWMPLPKIQKRMSSNILDTITAHEKTLMMLPVSNHFLNRLHF